ncbi:MAG: undecaprenyl-diphosphatase UppP [Candidatus Levybacteria bacterium]|nr:undecaprenyl-diphosphatase UppP [Candidatus Levybacteria bacterium]
MELYHVFVLSTVEGVTEFLPISSTAHLILTSRILSIPNSEFLTTFEVAIQLGAILAVSVLYFKKIMGHIDLLYKACIGFIPTGILGFLFFDYIKALFNSTFVPVLTLFLGGILIIIIEIYFKKTNHKKELKSLSNFTYKDALMVGLIQSVSMIPGVSRAAASIFGAMALKFDRQSAVEFSFLLAIPTMVAATGLDLVKTAPSFTPQQGLFLALGIILSFVTALVVIKWLIQYVQKNDFIGFGIYRIVLSIIYYLLFVK